MMIIINVFEKIKENVNLEIVCFVFGPTCYNIIHVSEVSVHVEECCRRFYMLMLFYYIRTSAYSRLSPADDYSVGRSEGTRIEAQAFNDAISKVGIFILLYTGLRVLFSTVWQADLITSRL